MSPEIARRSLLAGLPGSSAVIVTNVVPFPAPAHPVPFVTLGDAALIVQARAALDLCLNEAVAWERTSRLENEAEDRAGPAPQDNEAVKAWAAACERHSADLGVNAAAKEALRLSSRLRAAVKALASEKPQTMAGVMAMTRVAIAAARTGCTDTRIDALNTAVVNAIGALDTPT